MTGAVVSELDGDVDGPRLTQGLCGGGGGHADVYRERGVVGRMDGMD